MDEKYEKLTKELIARGFTISTMESCTSGFIASCISDTEGSSAVLKGGYVTYCNEAKIAAGVPEETIREHGVYSIETAKAMAAACRERLNTDIGIGITGSFGNPDPANADSVPGTVHFVINYFGRVHDYSRQLQPMQNRFQYKCEAAEMVCDELLKLLEG